MENVSEFAIATPALAPARYLVHWKGMGQDGHALQGEFYFMQQSHDRMGTERLSCAQPNVCCLSGGD